MGPSLLLSLAVAMSSPVTGSEEELAALFELPPELEVRLWADSPLFFNPTCMDVDSRGRIWVAEGVNYRKWDGRNPGLSHPGGDRIVILEDTDGDGVCDSSKVFVQDKDLVSPLGIAVLDDRVIVSSSPSAIAYIDADGDDRPEAKEIFLTGFGGPDHDHGLHSFVAGPEGRWYFNAGNAGPHLVTDHAGWSLRSGSVYRGGGLQEADNRWALTSDDGRIWTGGLVLSVDPDGTGLRVHAHNFRNNYEVALDSFGNLWQSDNDDDGNQCCRTLWVMEGGNHGYFSADGSRTWWADRRPGQSVQRAHWHQDDPGVVPAGTINGSGGPTGVAVYEGGLLPSRYQGAVLNADSGRNLVYAHLPLQRGAGYELERTVLIGSRADAESDDPHRSGRWFRPSDVLVGTDGAVYVSDWFDAGVGGHAMADREGYGRILRIAPKGDRSPPMELDLETTEGQLEALSCPAPNVRSLAAEALVAQGEKVLAKLLILLEEGDPIMRARALWLAVRTASDGRIPIIQAFADSDPRVRAAAVRALSLQKYDPLPMLASAARDDSPAVRREVAIALRDFDFDECGPILLEVATRYDGSDRYYLEALGIGMQGKEEEVLEALASTEPVRWSNALADLAWRLHPASSLPQLVERALSEELSLERRLQALDSIAFIEEEAAAEAMLQIAKEGPTELRQPAYWWIGNRDTNEWAAFEVAERAGMGARDPDQAVYRSGVIEAGAVEIEVDVSGADTLCLEVSEGHLGRGCDWADWAEPLLVGPEGELPLTELDWIWAEAGWGSVNLDRNADGGPMLIEGAEIPFGIGTHAPSSILFALPPGFERLRVRAGIDDGGSSQSGARPDVEFLVYVQRDDRGRLRDLRQVLLDQTAGLDARSHAAEALAADPAGGALLLQLATRGELAPEISVVVGAAIFSNPDLAVRALASEHFDRPERKTTLPPISQLALADGDVELGRAVFFGETASCHTCHLFDGEGGAVGPDLTAIREKYGRAELLDSILNPSAGILMGYESWMIETDDGLVVCGHIVSDGAVVVVKETSGRQVQIESEAIVARTQQKLSSMPDNVALGLTPHELTDLCAFLLQASVGAD